MPSTLKTLGRSFRSSRSNSVTDGSDASSETSSRSPSSSTKSRTFRKNRGVCVTCGIPTHKVKRFSKVELTNENVFCGVCIACNPVAVPPSILADWELKERSEQKDDVIKEEPVFQYDEETQDSGSTTPPELVLAAEDSDDTSVTASEATPAISNTSPSRSIPATMEISVDTNVPKAQEQENVCPEVSETQAEREKGLINPANSSAESRSLGSSTFIASTAVAAACMAIALYCIVDGNRGSSKGSKMDRTKRFDLAPLAAKALNSVWSRSSSK